MWKQEAQKVFVAPSKIFHQLGMDLIGLLPQKAQVNKYIITLTDSSSSSSPLRASYELRKDTGHL